MIGGLGLSSRGTKKSAGAKQRCQGGRLGLQRADQEGTKLLCSASCSGTLGNQIDLCGACCTVISVKSFLKVTQLYLQDCLDY